MKRKKIFGKNRQVNKKAVSAVIGVILMVAITVAIAATVFVFVNDLRNEQEEPELMDVEGWVVDAYNTLETCTQNGENYSIWQVILGSEYDAPIENATTYYMIFTHGMSPPPEDVHLRLFYTAINHDAYDIVFDVEEVKSL